MEQPPVAATSPSPPAISATWDGTSLAYRCECQRCQRGDTTEQHQTESHDQSLQQRFTLGEQQIEIKGGTTKCARVFVQYIYQQYLSSPESFHHKTVIEVGSGTGLCGIALVRHRAARRI